MSGADAEKSAERPAAEERKDDPVSSEELAGLKRQVDLLAQTLEKMRLAEYIAYLNRPGRLIGLNFLVGLVRGLGTALGAGILAGVAYIILKRIIVLNLPVIGEFISELSHYITPP